MGLRDYLDEKDKRVRVRTEGKYNEQSVDKGVNINDVALYAQIQYITHTNNTGDDQAMTDVPSGVLRYLLDVATRNSAAQAQAWVYWTRKGVAQFATEVALAYGANFWANPLKYLPQPIILPEGTTVHLKDSAWQAGRVTTHYVRYIDIPLVW